MDGIISAGSAMGRLKSDRVVGSGHLVSRSSMAACIQTGILVRRRHLYQLTAESAQNLGNILQV